MNMAVNGLKAVTVIIPEGLKKKYRLYLAENGLSYKQDLLQHIIDVSENHGQKTANNPATKIVSKDNDVDNTNSVDANNFNKKIVVTENKIEIKTNKGSEKNDEKNNGRETGNSERSIGNNRNDKRGRVNTITKPATKPVRKGLTGLFD